MSNVNKTRVGEGKVYLISGGGKVNTDIAARFVKSERGVEEIIASEYDAKIVENIVKSGHLAATEFDYFVFGIEGYSRVAEVQLVRKRIASYLIKSGKCELGGKRQFNVVLPGGINRFASMQDIALRDDGNGLLRYHLVDTDDTHIQGSKISLAVNSDLLLEMIEKWYQDGIRFGILEEKLRYMKPQATEFKAIIGMNAHALMDFFNVRCCKNASEELQDMARKMLRICKECSPDVFKDAGPNCMKYGYCPEGKYQNPKCKGIYYTKEEAIKILEAARKERNAKDECKIRFDFDDPIFDLSEKDFDEMSKKHFGHSELTFEEKPEEKSDEKKTESGAPFDHRAISEEYKKRARNIFKKSQNAGVFVVSPCGFNRAGCTKDTDTKKNKKCEEKPSGNVTSLTMLIL